jgi:epoxide hydrolase-like predicted phosphatase
MRDGRRPSEAARSGSMKTLLLDFGGVLTTPVRESFAAFARDEGIDPEALWRCMRDVARTGDDPFTLVETGRIDLDEFDRRLADLFNTSLGCAIVADNLKVRLFSRVGPDEAMIGAVRRAREQAVPTGLISNSWGGNYGEGGYQREMFDELFDHVVISGEVGLRKPQPEIYLLAAERFSAEPSECVFVDDFKVNADGATAVGMRGIQHTTADETIPQLEEFLGVALR